MYCTLSAYKIIGLSNNPPPQPPCPHPENRKRHKNPRAQKINTRTREGMVWYGVVWHGVCYFLLYYANWYCIFSPWERFGLLGTNSLVLLIGGISGFLLGLLIGSIELLLQLFDKVIQLSRDCIRFKLHPVSLFPMLLTSLSRTFSVVVVGTPPSIAISCKF